MVPEERPGLVAKGRNVHVTDGPEAVAANAGRGKRVAGYSSVTGVARSA